MAGDDDLEPRLGRIRAPGSPRGRRYLHAVLAAAARQGTGRVPAKAGFAGARLGRGAVAGRLLGRGGREAGRRAIVKTRLVRLGRGIGGMRAHLGYLQRDAATRDGAPGQLYDGGREGVDGRAFQDRCAGDRHQFRIIVSPEDGHLYDDLKPLVRRFMARMEEDLGTRLDWVAVDHADTLHPHSHIVIRGRDQQGRDLVIAPAYFARGMRERLEALVSLDLGPRTALEVAAQQRQDVTAERFTGLDRQLLRLGDEPGRVRLIGEPADRHSLLVGRLRKLERLGLASQAGGGQWRIDGDLEARLRALGERGDIVRTMQRALKRAAVERAVADHCIDWAPGEELIGRVIHRGLTDELSDRHFLLIDGIDGRVHHVAIGDGAAVGPMADGAIVRAVPVAEGVRASDRTMAAIAAANGGRYSADLHRAHDPGASAAFIASHVRRLEALRRPCRLERDAEGSWTLAPDHLERVARAEAALARRRPVRIELLSPLPLDQLAGRVAASWLDHELDSAAPLALRDQGFGSAVRRALADRRAWLIDQGLADDGEEGFALRRGALALLVRRELAAAAAILASEIGKPFEEAVEGLHIGGRLRRRVDLASGRFALVETERSFSLLPWRPVLEQAIGKEVGGVVRARGTSWTIGRGRGLAR